MKLQTQLFPRISFLDGISLFASLSALFFCATLLIWGLARGYDFMDEGFYLLISKSPWELNGIGSFHYFLYLIPSLFSCRILDLRVAQVATQACAAIMLSCAYLAWLHRLRIIRSRYSLLTGILFAVFANFLIFAKYPFSLSYNSLTGLFLFGSAAILLAGGIFSGTRAQLLCAALSGLLFGWCILVKFPACIVFVIVVLIILRFLGYRAPFLSAASFLCFTFLAIFIFMFRFGINAIWSADSSYALNYLLSNKTLHSSLLKAYCDNLVDVWCHFNPILSISIIVTFLTHWFFAHFGQKLFPRAVSQVSVVLPVVTFGVFDLWLVEQHCLVNNMYTAHVFYLYSLMLTAQAFGLILGSRSRCFTRLTQRQFGLVTALLFLVAITCSFGTSNPLLYQSTIYSASLFLYMFGVSNFSCRLLKNDLMPVIVTISSCLIASFQFYDGFVRHPYAMGSNLRHAAVPARQQNLKGLKLDQKAVNFLNDLEDILTRGGFHSGDEVFGFYNMPGLIYAMGANSKQLGWFSSFPGYVLFNEHFLGKMSFKQSDRVFVLLGWNSPKTITQGLLKAGLHFPGDFELIGQVKCPVQIGLLDGKADSSYQGGVIDVYSRVVRK